MILNKMMILLSRSIKHHKLSVSRSPQTGEDDAETATTGLTTTGSGGGLQRRVPIGRYIMNKTQRSKGLKKSSKENTM